MRHLLVFAILCTIFGAFTALSAARQPIPDWLVLRKGQSAYLLPGSDGKAHLCEAPDRVWQAGGKLRLGCASAVPGTRVTVRGWKAGGQSALQEPAVFVQLPDGGTGWATKSALTPIVPVGTEVQVIGDACAAQFARFHKIAQSASLQATYAMCKGNVVDQVVLPNGIFLKVRFERGGNEGRFEPNVVMFAVDPDDFESWKPLNILDI